MSTVNRIIKNTGYSYAKKGINMFITLYTTRLVLNALGASDFGIYSIVGGAIGMLDFLNAAMAGATQRFMSYSEGQGDKHKLKLIFNISTTLHFFLAFMVGAGLLVAGQFFFDGILNLPSERISAAKVVYGSLIASTMLSVMSVPYAAVLNAHENIKYYSLMGVAEATLRLILATYMTYTSFDKLIYYGITMACVPFITLTVMRSYCHRHYMECVISPTKYWDKGLAKEMIVFAGWNLTGTIGLIIGNRGNELVLNKFFGTILNAAIGVGNQLCGMLNTFGAGLLSALNPVIVKKEGGGDRQSMLEYSYTGCKMSYLLFAMFCLPCLIETPFVLKLWLKSYPEWTVLFVRFQIIRTLLEQSTSVLGTSLNATGQIKGENLVKCILFFIPMFLLWAAFRAGASPAWYFPIVIFVMVILMTAVRLYFCHKFCGLHIWDFLWRVFLPCVMGSLVVLSMGGLVTSFMHEGFIRLLLCTSLMIAMYSLTTYFILDKRERTIVKNIAFQVRSRVLRHGSQRYDL